jgi:hypothetical protein
MNSLWYAYGNLDVTALHYLVRSYHAFIVIFLVTANWVIMCAAINLRVSFSDKCNFVFLACCSYLFVLTDCFIVKTRLISIFFAIVGFAAVVSPLPSSFRVPFRAVASDCERALVCKCVAQPP